MWYIAKPLRLLQVAVQTAASFDMKLSLKNTGSKKYEHIQFIPA
jgi:hypothetical protein